MTCGDPISTVPIDDVRHDIDLRVPVHKDAAAFVVGDCVVRNPRALSARHCNSMTTIAPNYIWTRFRARGQKESDPGMRVLRNVYSDLRDVLDPVVDDASDAPVIQLISVFPCALDPVPVKGSRSPGGGAGQMTAVPPASEREPLDCNVLAADKDGVSCGTGGLDHRLLLTVESDPNDLGRNGQVLAAGSAHQHPIPRLRQGDLLLDLFPSVAIDL